VAFNYVASSGAEAGLTLEQTAATMMVLSNHGLRASTIGTGLRQVLSKLLSPNQKLQEAYEEHSISLEKINPSTVGWGEALKNLSSVMYDHKKGVVDMGKAYQLFELRGAQAAAILVKSYISGDYQKMLESTYEVGSAMEMAGIQAEGLGQKWTNLGNKMKTFAIALGEAGIVGTLKALVDAVRGIITVFEYFATDTIGKTIIQVSILTGTLYGLLKIITLIKASIVTSSAFIMFGAGLAQAATGAAKLTAILGALSLGLRGVLTVLTGPIGIIAGLSLLGVMIHRAATANERFIQQTGEEIVKNLQVVNSLEAYRGALSHLDAQLNEGKNVQFEYSAVVKRMISDHPELRKQIDQTRLAYKDYRQELDDTLKKTIALQARQLGTEFAAKLKAQQTEIAKESSYYDKVLERKDALSKADEFMANSRKRLTALNKDYAQTTEEVVKYLVDLYRVGGMNLAQISALERMMFGATEAGNQMAASIHERVVAELLRAQPEIAGTAEEIEKMSDRMREFANNLKPADRLDFLKAFKQLQNEIASDKDVNRKSKLLSQEDMKAAIKMKEDQFLKEYQLKLNQRSKIESAEAQTSAFLARMETDRTDKIKAEWQAREEQIDAFLAREIEAAKTNETRKNNAIAQADEARKANEKKKNYDLMQLEIEQAEEKIELEKTLALTRLEIERRGIKEGAEYKEEMQKKENEITVTALTQLMEKRKEIYERALSEFGEADERTIALRQKYASSVLAVEVALTAGTKREVDARLKYDLKMTQKHLEEKHTLGLISTEAYLLELKKLRDEHAIDEEEYTRRLIAVQDNVFQQLEYGIQRSRAALKSLGEFWIQIGEQISSVIAENLTSAWYDYLEGAKTAKEAFVDFAKSTLKWLAQLIIKFAIMRAISGIFGGGVASTESGMGAVLAGAFHQGGIVGKKSAARRLSKGLLEYAPRLHSGLMPGEYPAILKKNEGVFTPEQMQALGSGNKGINLTLDKVIIQAVDSLSFTQMLQKNPRALTGILKEAITRGDMGLISAIREASA